MPSRDFGPGPLAIIGIGCLFPKGDGPAEFWSTIASGIDGITPVPPSHWRPEDYFDADPKSPDRTYAARGGFVPAVDFDPMAHGISPNNLEAIDSAQLLGLVVADAALRDAGYGPERSFDRDRVSVILGVTGTLELVIPLGARLGHPLWRRALRDAGVPDDVAEDVVARIGAGYVPWQENSFPGLLGNVVAGRVANRLNLGGTNCVVDAACASSLSALHLAALELDAGRSDMVLTGGVDTFNDIFMYMCFSKTPALSPTGDARPFSDDGDGTILGEGIGMVVVKRLADAERDGDRIHAVIRGLGSSSDGKGNAVYAPSAQGQAKALRRAYELAGISPATVELVEAHGTGTKVGDATEAASLAEVFGSSATPGRRGWCALGSIKSQIGHTKAAAGVAGLIKAALALEAKTLPPTIKVKRPLPGLEDGSGPFYLNAAKRPWMPAADHPRRAAVSAFGFGGSNFHCVLEEYEVEKMRIDWDDAQIVPLSASDRRELADSLERVSNEWAGLATWSAARRAAAWARKQFRPGDPARLIFVLDRRLEDWAKAREAALARLRAEDGLASWSVSAGSSVAYFGAGKPTGKLAVLFPGQGSQYVGMLRDLACAFPRMRTVLEEADRAFAQDAPAGSPRLTDRIYPKSCLVESDRSRLEAKLRATEVAQPAIGAVSLGALLVLRDLGVEPEAACGHSYGELTALCAAGRFPLADLLSLSMLRGRLMAAGDSDRGAMLAVQAPLETIAAVTREERIELVIANRNAPNQAVLSGLTREVERAERVFKDRKIRGVRLPVAAAFHSELVAQASKPFRAALEKIELGPASIPVFANTTAEVYPDNPPQARELLAGQLARPVEFVEEIRNLHRAGARVFLEVGPGAKLSGLVGSILEGREHVALALDSGEGRRSGLADLARVLARLAALGHPARVDAWDPDAESQTEPRNRPGSHTVPINGANYLRPREPLPPSRRKLETQKVAQPMTTVDATAVPAPKVLSPAAPVPPAPAPAPAPALAEAMRIANDHFVAIQRMQEQTADVHRRFLEGQEAAQRNLLSLIEVQRGLFQSSLGPAVAPVTLPAPAPVFPAPEIPEPIAAPSVPAAPAAPVAPVAPAAPAAKLAGVGTDQIVALVAEKTGYPAEMLGLDMDLDGDLGIDSIKRVEIFSAFQEKYPELPVVSSDKLGTLRTLRDVVEFLGTANETPAETNRPAAKGARIGQEEILALVAEKTGYPIEMLGLDHELDGDLGIDSIKRVEIFSAFQERFPEAPVVQSDQLGSFRRLRDVIEFLASAPSAPQAVAKTAVPAKPADSVMPAATSGVERWTARLVACPKTASDGDLAVRPGTEVWITDDGSELAPAVQAELARRGLAARIVTGPVDDQASRATLGGLVVLCPASGTRRQWLAMAFAWVQQAVRSFAAGGGFLAGVSRLDGGFGFSGGPIADPLSGGLAGLLKTAALEYPGIHCRALDLADDFGSPAEEAAAIVEALTRPADDGAIELGLSTAGPKRVELVPVPAPSAEPSRNRSIEPGDVVIVTGGARGVTAAVAVALARRYQPTLVLLGRGAEPEVEPPWLGGLAGEDEIRRALLDRAGSDRAPRALREEVTRIHQARAMRATFREIESAGGRCVYHSVDIRDERRVENVLARVRNEHGPIRGLVHGAGVLADRRLEDKTAEQFATVLDTKVHGLEALLAGLDPEELRLLVLFASSTARFGRVGQVDYAVANECLNKLGQCFARRHLECRVLAANWGPWAGGMVTESLAKLFNSEGVELIGLAEGSAALIEDIERSPRPPVEIVYLGAGSRAPGLSRPAGKSAADAPDDKLESTPDALAVAFERTLDLAEYPVLDCHRIKGHPVLPLALMAEWLAHAALHENPGLVFHGFDELRVTKGIVLADDEPIAVRVLAGKAAPAGPFHVARAELRSAGTSDVPRATARIVLASKLPVEQRRIADEPTSGPELAPETLYEGVLFHGSLLRGIERIMRCDAKGIDAWSRSAPGPASWIRRPLRGSWLADPLVLDVAFQLMIVWTTRQRGAPSLPCHVRGYRQFARAFPTDGTRIVIQVKGGAEYRALADIEFLDRRGSLVARMEDYECVLDPALALAFEEGRLAGAAQRSAPR